MKNKKIVLAVCGSVAATEAPKLVRELRRKGLDVECVMSHAAQNIIHPNVLEWASGSRVITEITGAVEHVRLCGIDGEASVLLVYPATSNTLSKIACGIDDSPVTTFAATALGSAVKVIMAPAMHYSMYKNPFVGENLAKLRKNGVIFLDPRVDENKAKVAQIDDAVKAVLKHLGKK